MKIIQFPNICMSPLIYTFISKNNTLENLDYICECL